MKKINVWSEAEHQIQRSPEAKHYYHKMNPKSSQIQL